MKITIDTQPITSDYYGQLYKIEVSLKSDPSNKQIVQHNVYGKLRKSVTRAYINEFISELKPQHHNIYNYRLITL